LYSDTEILDAVQAYMFSSDHADLVGYRTQSLERDLANKRVFMHSMRRVCHLGSMTNARVLDVGCGFGWQALAVSMIGGNRVVASDILPSMIEGTTECVRSLRAEGTYKFDVLPVQGDICRLDFPDDSFEAIYSFEAIEHVHDIDAMFENCVRMLAPGGTIILCNDCNFLHKRTRESVNETFEKRENSWEWCAYLKSIRPIEHANARPFAVIRKEIVRQANPSLNERDVEAIAWVAAGMLKPQIESLARSYKTGDVLPLRRSHDWCRDPITGEYAERLFDPYELASKFRRLGLSARVLHDFRRWPLCLANSIRIRALNNALFQIKPSFTVVATSARRRSKAKQRRARRLK